MSDAECLRLRFERAYEEIRALQRIKAEVNYKEIGIDDGASAREQDELESGGVRKAVIKGSTSGAETPGPSSLVFLHVTFRRGTGNDGDDGDDGDDEGAQGDANVIVSTRKEHGGSGVPCLYRLNEGRWRPVRGLEIALSDMPKGERSLVVMKPSMCFLHENVEDSWMARTLRPLMGTPTRSLHMMYEADVELVAWIDDVVPVDLEAKDCEERVAFKRIVAEGTGWETPREPFSVSLLVTQEPVEQYGLVDAEPASDERTIECEIGDGTLSKDLEAVVCTMRKEEDAIVLCPAGGESVRSSTGQAALQAGYVQYRVSLLDMTQARDLMGDGKTLKKIARKGQGEFPIDCPMEDTTVVLRTKIRSKSKDRDAATRLTWMPLISATIDGEIEVSTGMGDLPHVVDAAVRLMLKGEVSVLTTDVDETLFRACLIDGMDNPSFSIGDRVEINIELVRFEEAPPIQLLEPEEKLAKARKFKEDGNLLFKKGMYPLAKSKYNKAMNCVGKGFEFSEEDIDEAYGIKASSMLNLAACAQKLDSYGEAIQWCERVLEDDSENTKALFRRSKALVAMARYDDALADLDAMVRIDPSLADDAEREKCNVRRKIKEADAKQRREFGNFFAR